MIEPDEFIQAVLVQIRAVPKHDGMKLNDSELEDLVPVCRREGEIQGQGRLKYTTKLGIEATQTVISNGKSAWAQALVHANVFKHMAGAEQKSESSFGLLKEEKQSAK